MPLAPGTRLGHYTIESQIGAGGMGEVYKAADTRVDRIVAIKKSSEKFSERFERETRAIAALNHPHICTLYDAGQDFLVMEYVDGKPRGFEIWIANTRAKCPASGEGGWVRCGSRRQEVSVCRDDHR
jgi:serine/threonine protein kinase